MKKGDARRQQLLERMADHVLAHGLQGASLRPLAAAVGTSDRLLLHYFADKEALLTATLTLVTQRLIAVLENARADPLPFQRFLPHLAAMLKDAQMQPYLRLWRDLIPFAAGETEPFRSIARSIASTLLTWVAAALDVEREEDRAPLAALTLALVEGFVIFDALGEMQHAVLRLLALRLDTCRWPRTCRATISARCHGQHCRPDVLAVQVHGERNITAVQVLATHS